MQFRDKHKYGKINYTTKGKHKIYSPSFFQISITETDKSWWWISKERYVV